MGEGRGGGGVITLILNKGHHYFHGLRGGPCSNFDLSNIFFHHSPHPYINNGWSLKNTYKSNIHTFYCSAWIPTLWAAPLVSSSLAIFVFIPITRGRDASTTVFLAMIENSQRFISRGFYQLS